MYGINDRDRLIRFYEDNESSIELSDFNELLADLNLATLDPIEEVEVRITVRVNVADLEAFSKDVLDVTDVGVSIDRTDTFSNGSATSYTFDVESITVVN